MLLTITATRGPHRTGLLLHRRASRYVDLQSPDVVTLRQPTPDAGDNRPFEFLPMGHFRHARHRFEWTRTPLRAGAAGTRHGVRHRPAGHVDRKPGQPTQTTVSTTGEKEVAA